MPGVVMCLTLYSIQRFPTLLPVTRSPELRTPLSSCRSSLSPDWQHCDSVVVGSPSSSHSTQSACCCCFYVLLLAGVGWLTGALTFY